MNDSSADGAIVVIIMLVFGVFLLGKTCGEKSKLSETYTQCLERHKVELCKEIFTR